MAAAGEGVFDSEAAVAAACEAADDARREPEHRLSSSLALAEELFDEWVRHPPTSPSPASLFHDVDDPGEEPGASQLDRTW